MDKNLILRFHHCGGFYELVTVSHQNKCNKIENCLIIFNGLLVDFEIYFTTR